MEDIFIPELLKENKSIQSYFNFLPNQQMEQLLSLKYPNGRNIITLRDREVMYEVICLLKEVDDFDLIKNELTNVKNRDDIIFGNREMFVPRYRAGLEVEMMRNQIEVEEGGYTCPKCKGNRTISTMSQTRSADEPMTTFIVCTDCQTKWKE
jgi:DNA-directed RNA polymerase subunit M/transcription elongation factor TFIIS